MAASAIKHLNSTKVGFYRVFFLRRHQIGRSGWFQRSESLRFSVLVSAVPVRRLLATGIMLVPSGRERDTLFSTREGQYKLLNKFAVDKLILISCSGPDDVGRPTFDYGINDFIGIAKFFELELAESIIKSFFSEFCQDLNPVYLKYYDKPNKDSDLDNVKQFVLGKRYLFTLLLNQEEVSKSSWFHSEECMVFVVDSDRQPIDQEIRVEISLVPRGRESDWLFLTKEGQLSLLKKRGLDRLVLVFSLKTEENPSRDTFVAFSRYASAINYKPIEDAQSLLSPLLLPFLPSCLVNNPMFRRPKFWFYADDLNCRVCLFIGEGTYGQFEICDDEFFNIVDDTHIRRRLRFIQDPVSVYIDCTIVPVGPPLWRDNFFPFLTDADFTFKVDHKKVVAKHHEIIVGVLSLLNQKSRKSDCLLCLGGIRALSLLSHLQIYSDIEGLIGVEAGFKVKDIAMIRQLFEVPEEVKLIGSDPIDFINELAKIKKLKEYHSFYYDLCTLDVLVVDWCVFGQCVSGVLSPPTSLIQIEILQILNSLISESGILLINVVSSDDSFHIDLESNLKVVFPQIIRFDIADGQYVILASQLPLLSANCHFRAIETPGSQVLYRIIKSAN